MHPAYFSQVDPKAQRQHLRAIVAVHASQTLTVPEIMLSSQVENGVQYTVIHSGGADRVARSQIDRLPKGTLTRVLLTTTKDERISLNVFDVTPTDETAIGFKKSGDGLKRFAIGSEASEEEQAALERHTEYNNKLEAGDLSTHAGTPSKRSSSLSRSDLALRDFLSRCSSLYVTHQNQRLLVKQRRLYEQVRGKDDAAVSMEDAEQGSRDWSAISEGCTLLTVALPGVEPRAALRRMLDLLELHRMQLQLAQVDTVDDPEGDGYVTLLRTVIRPSPSPSPLPEAVWENLKRDAARLKWVDDPALQLARLSVGPDSMGGPMQGLSLQRAEVLLALADLTLSILDRPLLSRVGVHERLDRPEERGLALAMADLLIARFDPSGPMDETVFLGKLDAATKRAEAAIRDEDSSALLGAIASAVRHTMRTNLFIARRWALTLRLDPSFFDGVLNRLPSSPGLSNKPYGVFFVAGRHFNGYHVRFSDIARGGLRVVLPPSYDIHVAESRRHFNECFRLAWAQQLKNKDIPEGGAKAVCLVYPVAGQERSRLLHKCVKKFTDSLLDLVSPRRTNTPLFGHGTSSPLSSFSCGMEALGLTSEGANGTNGTSPGANGSSPKVSSPSSPPATALSVSVGLGLANSRDRSSSNCSVGGFEPPPRQDPVVSRGGCESELLYLGPDENITPHDINWMASRAAQRGYAMPSAFISSKPEAGINHKEYGVTSEGVAVFLHEGLKAIGIDPKTQRFTVKLTGGPDGDVAGNMLRILHREYGSRVSVVGICDGFGVAEDPDGIPMAELLRLADEQHDISKLNPATLGPRGRLTLANTREGAALRNTMHNRVIADAFVPAGGRPSTVNASNWRDFLQADGVTPSARLVVEGANLFFDAKARASLFEQCGSDRISIIKDSSANKCGVICSSMEIVACMLLTEGEFKALKPRYVAQVIARLRELARLEAQMLFAEAVRDSSVALPALSERISVAILRVGLALDAALDRLPSEEQRALFPLVQESIPSVLFEDPAIEQRARTLPWPYQRSCITSGLCSRLVYREGLAFVEGLPDSSLAAFAQAYLRGEQRTRQLTAMVAAAGLSFGPEVEKLLMKGGVRAATEGILAQAKLVEQSPAYPVLAE